MENETQSNGQPENTDGVTQEKNQTNSDKVAYATYSKVMGTLKKREAQLEDLQAKLEGIELQKQQDEGNKDEVIATLRKRLDETESEKKQLKHNYAWNSIEGQIKAKAVEAGCVNPEKLIRLLPDEDLKAIEVDDSFRVNSDDLGRLIEKAKKDNSDIGLFGRRKANINDGPAGVPNFGSKKVEEMSATELKKLIKSL